MADLKFQIYYNNGALKYVTNQVSKWGNTWPNVFGMFPGLSTLNGWTQTTLNNHNSNGDYLGYDPVSTSYLFNGAGIGLYSNNVGSPTILWDPATSQFYAFDSYSSVLVISNTGSYVRSMSGAYPTAIPSLVIPIYGAGAGGAATVSGLASALSAGIRSILRLRLCAAVSSATSSITKLVSANRSVVSTAVSSFSKFSIFGFLWSYVYAGAKWIGVKTNSSTAAVSTDGTHWTAIQLPAIELWSGLANNGSVSVGIALDTNQIAYTTTGNTWSSAILPSQRLWKSIVAGGSTFVVVALKSDKCATSTDGINWTEYSMPSEQNWCSISWNGTVFCAISTSNICATSTDGQTWAQHTMPDSINYNSISWALGQFTAVATGPTNLAAWSDDGATWHQLVMPATADWTAVGPGVGVPNV
jgi:hypothetical protein